MVVISSRTFRENQKKYFDLATNERVIIKRKLEFLELVPRGHSIPESVSSSNDPYYDIPQNIEDLEKRIQDIKDGKTKFIPFTKEMQKNLLGE
jgi:antitoxin YefM